ncbi:MAG: MFS transporter [Acidobacteria bacterium]|nr:MFS transporter [Acidobacteriota bacterium]MCI0721518.1 MFS transporter [Acidobacteriota bacterium]
MSHPPTLSGPWYKWAVVGILWFVAFLNAIDRHAIYSLFPLLEKELSMSAAQLGLLGSAFVWAYALLLPFAGHVGDRYPREKVIRWALLGWSAVTALNALVASPNHLIYLRALLAVGEVFYLPASLAFLSEVHPEATRSTAIAIHLSAMSIGQVVGGAVGGYVGEHYDWRALFVVLGSAGILYAPLLWMFLHSPGSPAAKPGNPAEKLILERPRSSLLQSWRDLAGIVSIRFVGMAFVCYSIVGALLMTWLPYFVFNRFSTNLAVASFSANFYLELPTTLGVLAWGAAGDYAAQRNFRGRMLVQAASLMVAAPLFLAVGWSQTLLQVTVSLVLLGLLRGGWPPNTMPVICQVVPQTLRSTAYGAINCLGNVAAGLAALAGGVLGQRFGLGSIFTSCSLIYWLASAAMIYAALRPLQFEFRQEPVSVPEK